MKKIITFVMCMSLSAAVTAAGINANVSYDADKSILSVSGNAAEESPLYYEGVNAVIYPMGSENITADDVNSMKSVVYSEITDAEGNFAFEISMPDGLKSGKYTVKLSDGTSSNSYYIIHADTKQAAEALKYINAASALEMEAVLEQHIESVGADKAEYVKYSKDIADYIYKMKPKNGYAVSELLKAYICSITAAAMKSGDTTLENAINDYASYLEINAETEYANYSDEIKSEIESIMKSTDFNKDMKTFYKECRMLALVRKAGGYTELKKLVLENSEALGIDLYKYNKLGEYAQDKVFQNMYKNTFNKYSDIKTAFDSAVDGMPKDSGSSGTGGGGGTGGSGASKSNAVNSSFSNTVPKNNAGGFSDMSEHWAKENVDMLYKKGIVNGYTDGSFKPENRVTRAEFAKMLEKAFEIPNGAAADFSDVSASDWYYSCVNSLAGAGIITGFDGKFMPNELISRQDAAVMTERVLKSKGISFDGEYSFADSESIAEYAAKSVMNMAKSGIITGDNGYFRPNGFTTRAEAATLVVRALAAAGKGAQ